MERRDYLKNQIDQLGRVLGKLLADFIGLKSQGNVSEGVDMVNTCLKKELDFDIYDVIHIPKKQLINTLVKDKKLTNEHLESMANLLLEMALSFEETNEQQQSPALYERALILFEYLADTDSTYSFDRHFKMKDIRKKLE